MTTDVQPGTRRTGRWVTLARATWVAVTLLSIALFLVGAWAYYQVLLVNPFFNSTVAPRVSDLNSARLGLTKWGISVEAYAAILTGGPSLVAFASCLLGVLIFWRRSAERIGWLMSLLLVLMGTQVPDLANAFVQLHPEWYFLRSIVNELGTAAFLVLFMTFPNGQFVPRWTHWTLVLTIISGITSDIFPDSFLTPFYVPIGLAIVASAVFAQIYRYLRVSGPVERQQTKWVALSLVATPLAWVAGALLIPALFPLLTQASENAAPYNLLRSTFLNIASLLIPLSIGLSILRYRLWDIDLIIRRTLQYSVLSGLLALTYFGLIVVLQNTFAALTGQTQSPLVTVLSTLAIAALFLPLRRRVQAAIDRRFYRKKYDAAKTLAAFAATCRDETDLDKLTARLVEVVEETMQPESVTLWLKPTDDGRPLTAEVSRNKTHDR